MLVLVGSFCAHKWRVKLLVVVCMAALWMKRTSARRLFGKTPRTYRDLVGTHWIWYHNGVQANGWIAFMRDGLLLTSFSTKTTGSWTICKDGRVQASFGTWRHTLEQLPESSPPTYKVVERLMLTNDKRKGNPSTATICQLQCALDVVK